MSNVLRGLVLEENPAEKARMERITKLMGKVYAAKITSPEMPFVHGMYHNHHRRFCKKMDLKFQAEVKERMPGFNISQISSIQQENSNNNSSMSLLNRLNDSNQQPVKFGEGKKIESEIRAEMKKKVGGEVVVASEVKASSEIRRVEVSKEESQEKRRQFEAKRKEMQRHKEDEELRKENERIQQLQEERQRQREKERKRKEEADRKQRQRQRQRQREKERQRLKEKQQRQRRQRELQQRQKKAEQQRLALQAEEQRKKAIAIRQLKQQQRRQDQRRREEQRRKEEEERLASLKLQQQRQPVQSDEQYVEVVEDDSQSYYNIRQQEIYVPVEPQKVTRSEIIQQSANINTIFLSHLTTPHKHNFQQPQIPAQEKPESFQKQEASQPSNIIEQSASLTQSNIDAPSNISEKVESPSVLKAESNIQESPPSQSLSPLNKNILSGSQSINNVREQSNNESASNLLQSEIIEQVQKEENAIVQVEENVEIRVDKIVNVFLQLLQRQPSRCEHHEALLKQNAIKIDELTRQNEQLLRQQEQLAERSKKSAIAAELRIIDLQKQLKELREKLEQEQFYMVKPASKIIKRNNSAGKLSDQNKQPRAKAYSGEKSLKEQSNHEHSYQSAKNSSDEQP